MVGLCLVGADSRQWRHQDLPFVLVAFVARWRHIEGLEVNERNLDDK